MESLLVHKKKEPIIKPHSSGWGERICVVGVGVVTVYTLWSTLPIVAGAVVVGTALLGWQEARHATDPRKSERMMLMLHSGTPKHPSIYASRKALKTQFHTADINHALLQMVDHCELIKVKPTTDHPLRGFGEVYAFCDPDDGQIMMPIQALFKKLSAWGIEPTIAVDAATVADEQPQLIGSDTRLGAIGVDASTVADSTPSASPTNAAELLAVLEAQYPDLLKLVKAPPIRLVGAQRTGKSTVARKLSLLRSIFLPGHAIAWATPHREADNLVPDSLNPFGTTPDGAKDFGAIERVWSAVQKALDKGQVLNLSAVWDEFGGYGAFEDEETLGKSLKSMLREASKHGYYPILIVHGDQAAFYPGLKNFLTTLQNTTVKIETFGEAIDAFGTMRPTGRIEITWLDKSTSALQIPDWLTEDLLLSLQPTVAKPAVLDAVAPNLPVVDHRAVIGTPGLSAAAPVAEFKAADIESAKPEETLKQRVGKKLLEKLKASGDEWVKQTELVTNGFSQPKDREAAKTILEAAVNKNILERDEITNSNNTTTVLYRVKKKVSTNPNSPVAG